MPNNINTATKGIVNQIYEALQRIENLQSLISAHMNSECLFLDELIKLEEFKYILEDKYDELLSINAELEPYEK